jgi:hypothetical protein
MSSSYGGASRPLNHFTNNSTRRSCCVEFGHASDSDCDCEFTNESIAQLDQDERKLIEMRQAAYNAQQAAIQLAFRKGQEIEILSKRIDEVRKQRGKIIAGEATYFDELD